jgi:hypothetical protein
MHRVSRHVMDMLLIDGLISRVQIPRNPILP